jgi:pyridoxal phosphate enzyme (YggS family)
MKAPPDTHRRAELLASLGRLRARIVDVAIAAGRDPRAITLVAVTKTFPVEDARTLIELGVHDLGESRNKEAKIKAAQLSADELAVRWHFVGRVQTNKARSIATYASAVHSVDRVDVVTALADAADRLEREPIDVFLQLSLDGDPERGGALAADAPALADLVASRMSLRLMGVMAVAPLGVEPAAAFAELADAASRLVRQHPSATAISAGMSGDFEQAISAGSTHLRVGSALLGRRTPDFG